MQNHMATAALLADEARAIYDSVYELKHADFLELKHTTIGKAGGILVINGEMMQAVKEALINSYVLRYTDLIRRIRDCLDKALFPYELASLRLFPDESSEDNHG